MRQCARHLERGSGQSCGRLLSEICTVLMLLHGQTLHSRRHSPDSQQAYAARCHLCKFVQTPGAQSMAVLPMVIACRRSCCRFSMQRMVARSQTSLHDGRYGTPSCRRALAASVCSRAPSTSACCRSRAGLKLPPASCGSSSAGLPAASLEASRGRAGSQAAHTQPFNPCKRAQLRLTVHTEAASSTLRVAAARTERLDKQRHDLQRWEDLLREIQSPQGSAKGAAFVRQCPV